MNEKKYIEQYQFLRLSHMDLQQAIQTLGILKRYKRKDVRYALLRDFVVIYSRPFVGSDGKEITNHRLQMKYVPKDQRNLHRDIINKRNQLFAHNDLTFRNPRVVNWGTLEMPSLPMSFKACGYEKLDARYADLLDLAEAVIGNIDDDLTKRGVRIAPMLEQDGTLYFT